jgi:hypothetical protein
LERLTISPSGAFVVISLVKRGPGLPAPTRLEIYSPLTGKLVRQFSSNDLKEMISQFTNSKYPIAIKSYITMDVRWISKNTAIFEVQPVVAGTGVELAPQNISLVYNIASKKVERVEFYSRGQSSPINVPSHISKTTYTLSINNEKLYIQGKEVKNMPGSIKEADLTIIKK